MKLFDYKLLVLSIIIVMLFSMAACRPFSDADEAPWSVYEGEEFQFLYPEEWSEIETEVLPAGANVADNEVEEEMTAIFHVSVLEEREEEITAEEFEDFQGRFVLVLGIDELETINIDGRPGYIAYSVENNGYVYTYAFTYDDRSLYTFVYGGDEENYNPDLGTRIINYFEFKD